MFNCVFTQLNFCTTDKRTVQSNLHEKTQQIILRCNGSKRPLASSTWQNIFGYFLFISRVHI